MAKSKKGFPYKQLAEDSLYFSAYYELHECVQKHTTENEELTYYRKEFQIKKAEMNNLKYKLRGAFVKFKLVKNTFSSNQYVLKVSEEEFLELKNSIT